MPDDAHNAGGSSPESPNNPPSHDVPAKARPAAAIPPAPLPLDLADEDCPRCHKPLAHEAVMCINCGYDLKANVIREPELGEVVVTAQQSAGAKEFVTPGRGSAQVLATCGVFITIGALIIAGVNDRQWGAFVLLGSIAIMLYNILLHTCTGVVAVILAAKFTEERFTRLELAAARMFVAVALFYALSSLRLPINLAFVAGLLAWVSALGVYFGVVWWFFKKDRYGTALIALAHFLMWLLLQLGPVLASWVASGKTPAAGAV